MIKRAASPLASSSAKRTRPLLPDAQLAKLVESMKDVKELLVDKGDDRLLFKTVLRFLVAELALTDMKENIISWNNATAASHLKSFTESELDLWRKGVKNGIENNDWGDLIAHRKYILDSQTRTSCLSILGILLAAKLHIMKMPDVASATKDALSQEQELGAVNSKYLLFIFKLPTDCSL